jgi:PAS domain S-box-containing protein
MPDGVLVADKDEGIVLTNPATARMLGLDEEDLAGQPLFESIKDDRLVSLIREATRLEERDLRGISSEIAIEGDPPVCLRAHACPVKSDDGEVLGSVAVLEDISYLKELDQMKSDFVNMVSHDLRSPLATIDQQLCVIKEGIAGEVTRKQLEIIEKVRTRIRGLLTFTRNLLDLSKIEAGRTPLYKEPLKLGEIAEKVAESLRQEAQKKDVAMEVTLADDLPVIYGDRDHMEMVFTNLMSNAIRYTPAGGRVAVKMEADGNHLKAEVADTGIGIPKADLPRIFDKFYRAQVDRTKRLDGSGLGLFIVKNVVEAHFGTIEVQSEVGRGTTFKVQIPRGAEAP